LLNAQERCLQLAAQGFAGVGPNPMVGAVLLNEHGQILSEGYHKKRGSEHAEIDALKKLLGPNSLHNVATLVCNLEPCSHEQKLTPPCAPYLSSLHLKHFHLGTLDPNPLVSGRGIEMVKKSGTTCSVGHLEGKNRFLNRLFFLNQEKKRPYLHLKIATTLDGSFGQKNQTQKISGPTSQLYVQALRSMFGHVLVGYSTWEQDKPRLNVRAQELLNEYLLKQPSIFIAGRQGAYTDHHPELKRKIELFSWDNRENFHSKLKALYQEGVYGLFIEAGPRLAQYFLEQGCYDEISWIVSPYIQGSDLRLNLSKNFKSDWSQISWNPLGQDLCLHALHHWES
jgi:diaminohydroxyphosphoribosylaminopyrimidine deaminase/5-amino-6-(5-phosphoribosylamino)uracil reductase